MTVKIDLYEDCECPPYYGHRPKPDCVYCQGTGKQLTDLGQQVADLVRKILAEKVC